MSGESVVWLALASRTATRAGRKASTTRISAA